VLQHPHHFDGRFAYAVEDGKGKWMKKEHDFSKGARGKFYRAGAKRRRAKSGPKSGEISIAWVSSPTRMRWSRSA
jgi:hypothetical protein